MDEGACLPETDWDCPEDFQTFAGWKPMENAQIAKVWFMELAEMQVEEHLIIEGLLKVC